MRYVPREKGQMTCIEAPPSSRFPRKFRMQRKLLFCVLEHGQNISGEIQLYIQANNIYILYKYIYIYIYIYAIYIFNCNNTD